MGFRANTDHGTTAILLTLGISFGILAVAAAFEEAFFRGYILQTFSRAGFAWPAIKVTALFFASAHITNPGANWISVANTALAGIWFGVAYLKTRNLWFPFGLHLTWNWTQGAIFGIEISGLKELITAPLLREVDHGPAWLTGGDYGLEASLACTIALIASTLIIWYAPFINASKEMTDLTSHERIAE